MAADASSIHLIAYDSVGTPFYTYDFLLEGEVITPSVTITAPEKGAQIQDSVMLHWYTFDPAKDAKVSLYYSQNANASNVNGMTLIAADMPASTDRYMWHTRNIMPKGTYYIYAVITSGGKSYMGNGAAEVRLMDDTTPPPAPTNLRGYINQGQYHLWWQNPTHLVHIDTPLADFSNGTGKMQVDQEEGTSMAISVADGALKCDYAINTAWATASADYVFDAPADMRQTPFLTFRLKGNGTSTDVRLVCKNMSNGHEDWWYTENFNLSKNTWQTITVDLRTLKPFDWYGNTDDKNHCEGIVRISFGISTGNSVSGTFYLDDLSMSGDVYPAPDYAQTVIVRKDNAFPTGPTDGTEIYRGTAEDCIDPSAVVGQVYYYAAFAADDRNNWSAPDATAQWKSENVQEGSGTENLRTTDAPHKFIHNGQVYIRRANNTFTVLGTKAF